MIDNSRCGECGGALVFEEHLVLTCESCSTLHGDAGLSADPTTSRTDAEQAVIDAAKALAADWAGYESGVPDWDKETLALIAAVDRLAATEATT